MDMQRAEIFGNLLQEIKKNAHEKNNNKMCFVRVKNKIKCVYSYINFPNQSLMIRTRVCASNDD